MVEQPSLRNGLVVTLIPNWNLKKDLGECIESLENSSYANHIIVVIDNGSTDGSTAYVQERFTRVQVIALNENRGYAGALNVGIEYALAVGAEYVFVLNNDTIVPPDTIARLVQTMESDPKIGIASPKVLFHNHPEIVYNLGQRRYPLAPLPLDFGYHKKDRAAYVGIMNFDYVSGCSMLIRASIFQQIGLFDISYFMYYEDSDFCRRVRDKGYLIVCNANVIIYHKASLSATKLKKEILKIRTRNRVHFYRHHKHGIHPWFTYLALVLVGLARCISFLFRGEKDLAVSYKEGFLEGWKTDVPSISFSWDEK